MTGTIIVIFLILLPYLILFPLKWLVVRTNYLNAIENPYSKGNYLTDSLGDFMLWFPIINYITFIGLMILWDREKFGFVPLNHKQPSKLAQIVFLLPKPVVPIEDKEKMGRISIKQN